MSDLGVSSDYQENFGKLVNAASKGKILVVGAGGIGCELLKDLVQMGFINIVIIDLDTISVSNLNRQFLFRKEHVGRFKAEVAKESILAINPNCKITAYCASILDENEFNLLFFKKFSLVFGAVDNFQARSHINRMCRKAKVPWIDAGAQEFHGQAQSFQNGPERCYSCDSSGEEENDIIPECTLHSIPNKPDDCINYAKGYLFKKYFGTKASFDEEWKTKNIEESKFASDLFNHEFNISIPTELPSLPGGDPIRLQIDENNKLLPTGENVSNQSNDENVNSESEHYVQTDQELVDTFIHSANELREKRVKDEKPWEWDKDDPNHVDFLVSATNLRAKNFHFEKKSKFEIKGKAGNIIPTMATCNAVVAGFLVLEAVKLLASENSENCEIWLFEEQIAKKRPTPIKYLIKSGNPNPKNPKCGVCNMTFISITCNVTKHDLQWLKNLLEKEAKLGCIEMICVGQRLVFEEGDEELGGTSRQPLTELGFLAEEDAITQVFPGPMVEVSLIHKKDMEEDYFYEESM